MTTKEKFKYFSQELRFWYKKYYSYALTCSIALHLLLLGLYYLIQKLSEESAEAPMVRIMKYSDLGPPPSLANEQAPQPVAVQAAAALPSIAIPIPVPDEQAPAEQTIATQTEMSQQTNTSTTGTGTGDSIVVGSGDIGKIQEQTDNDPGINDYVPVEKNPEPVKIVQPAYPDIAIRAGLEGTVLVKVLVNKDGRVEKSVMIKNDGMNVFDEPALTAAKHWVFTPAIMNGHPVKVWVVVPLRFRLR